MRWRVQHLDVVADSGTSSASTVMQEDRGKLNMELFAYRVQLLDPDLIFRMIGFTTFLMAWLIRLVDPTRKYPAVAVK